MRQKTPKWRNGETSSGTGTFYFSSFTPTSGDYVLHFYYDEEGGPSFIDGDRMEFDGKDDYLSLDAKALPEQSVTLKMKFEREAHSAPGIFQIDKQVLFQSDLYEVYLEMPEKDANGPATTNDIARLCYKRYYGDTEAENFTVDTDYIFEIGMEYYVVVTDDQQTAKIYVNFQEEESYTLDTDERTDCINDWFNKPFIGSDWNLNYPFRGSMDIFEIYSAPIDVDLLDVELDNSTITGDGEFVLEKYPGKFDDGFSTLLYHFEDGSGTNVEDYGYRGGNGTITGTGAWVVGKFGGGYLLKNNTYITVEDNVNINYTNNLTLEAWIKPAQISSNSPIIGKDGAYKLDFSSSSGYLRGSLNINNSWVTITDDTTQIYPDEWTHVAFTYDGVNMRLWVNGTNVKTTSQTGTIEPSPYTLYIGKNSTNYFNGIVDEVSLSGYAIADFFYLDHYRTIGSVIEEFTLPASYVWDNMEVGLDENSSYNDIYFTVMDSDNESFHRYDYFQGEYNETDDVYHVNLGPIGNTTPIRFKFNLISDGSITPIVRNHTLYTAADSDGDGLGDDWETDNTASNPGDDLDSDGISNLYEFQFECNPRSSDSLPLYSFPGGDGFSGSPWWIETIDDLQAIKYDLSAYYILKNDIDASVTATTWDYNSTYSFYQGFMPLGNYEFQFGGSLDGQGYSIYNLHIDRSKAEVALFGYVGQSGTITDLRLENIDIKGVDKVAALAGLSKGSITNCRASGVIDGYNDDIGGLVGFNEGDIENCCFDGTVEGDDSVGGIIGTYYYQSGSPSTFESVLSLGDVSGDDNVGGLIGKIYNSATIEKSTSAVTVEGNECVGGLIGSNGDSGTSGATITSCYSVGDVDGDTYVGGLVGYNAGPIEDSFSECDAGNAGSSDVGGLVGYNKANVDDSYSIGVPTGTTNVGGLIGNHNSGTVTNSVWDKDTSGITSGTPGTGKTTAEMKTQTTFTGMSWDFTNTWWMVDSETRPLLIPLGDEYEDLSFSFENRDMPGPDSPGRPDFLDDTCSHIKGIILGEFNEDALYLSTAEQGRAIRFDGVDDCLITTTGIVFPTEHTIEFNIFPELKNGLSGTYTADRTIIYKENEFGIYLTSDSKIKFVDSNGYSYTSDKALDEYQWNYVALTVDDSDELIMYINGHDPSHDGPDEGSDDSIFTISSRISRNNPVSIGAQWTPAGGTEKPFKGIIDELKIYRGAKTPSDGIGTNALLMSFEEDPTAYGFDYFYDRSGDNLMGDANGDLTRSYGVYEGRAAKFDGTGDYIFVDEWEESKVFGMKKVVTIECWIYPEDLDSSNQGICGFGGDTNGNGNWDNTYLTLKP